MHVLYQTSVISITPPSPLPLLNLIRPGWKDFLREISAKYEMHIYTMGTRAYAEQVCAAIDPDASLFGGRILSRDESGSVFCISPTFHTLIDSSLCRLNAKKFTKVVSM